jgi:glucokinase
MSLTIGVDIGGTKVLGGLVDDDGTVVAQARRDTPADAVDKTLDAIVEVVTELAEGHDVVAVGVGAAGWFDVQRNRAVFAPNLAWRDEPLRDRLRERLPVPVLVDNDGNVAAWAEFRYGAARAATESMVLVTIGTGIGGGLVLDGKLVAGANGMAGEPGHTRSVRGGRPCGCGRHGCLEQYASGSALVRAARAGATADRAQATRLLELAGGSVDAISGVMVTRAAKEGDPVSCAAFAEIGGWLGSGLADLAYVLDPEILVLGGGVVDAGDLLLGPTRESFLAELPARGKLPIAPIVLATLGPLAGVVGAADLARQR